jgi:hypothetical protein
LLVLGEADYSTFAGPGTIAFGMPSLTEGNLVAPTGSIPFWRPVVSMIDDAVPEQRDLLRDVYGDDVDLSSYFELNTFHELAHLYHEAVPFGFPMLIIRELFANLAQYAYVATHEPEALPALETLPLALVGVPAERFRYRTLVDFERLYFGVGGSNYLWYWGHLQLAAKRIFENGGATALLKLWSTFIQPYESHVRLLETDVDPVAAAIVRRFTESGAVGA